MCDSETQKIQQLPKYISELQEIIRGTLQERKYDVIPGLRPGYFLRPHSVVETNGWYKCCYSLLYKGEESKMYFSISPSGKTIRNISFEGPSCCYTSTCSCNCIHHPTQEHVCEILSTFLDDFEGPVDFWNFIYEILPEHKQQSVDLYCRLRREEYVLEIKWIDFGWHRFRSVDITIKRKDGLVIATYVIKMSLDRSPEITCTLFKEAHLTRTSLLGKFFSFRGIEDFPCILAGCNKIY